MHSALTTSPPAAMDAVRDWEKADIRTAQRRSTGNSDDASPLESDSAVATSDQA